MLMAAILDFRQIDVPRGECMVVVVLHTVKQNTSVLTNTRLASFVSLRTHRTLALKSLYFSGGHFEFWLRRPSRPWKFGWRHPPSERARKMLLDPVLFGGSWGFRWLLTFVQYE